MNKITASLMCTFLTSLAFYAQSEVEKKGNHYDSLYLTSKNAIEKKIYHSGGIVNDTDLCPKSPLDTIVPIRSLNDKTNTNTPYMTIEGIQTFIHENKITSITDLLNHFPDHYRTNFSLVEHTRAAGQSNLQFPRIVLFGSDGRFLLNIGTKPDDPLYNMLDVAELNMTTGRWEFSVFDFSKTQPSLTRNDPSCNECHGHQNSRPIWGNFQEWTGVFGDSVVDGPRPEALDHTHAIKMNEIYRGQGGSKRFDFLLWKPILMHRGGARDIAHHDFGPELLLSNLAMGSATAHGAFIRLVQNKPLKYKSSRKLLLLAYYQKRVSQTRYPIKINHSKHSLAYATQKNHQIADKLSSSGVNSNTLDTLLLGLGLDTHEAFSLATRHEKEQFNTNWSLAVADLYDLLMLQVLDELRRDDAEVSRIATKHSPAYPVYGCPDTVSNVAEMVDFKMLHLFHLAGESRYKVNWVYYPKDLDDIYDQVFLPIADELIDYLTRG